MNKNMTRHPVVYGLLAGGSFGYVGMTRVNVKTRLWEHRSRSRSGHTAPVYEWMRSVGVDLVEAVVLDEDSSSESEWIVKLLAEGHPLANQKSRDGVENSLSAETKKKIGASNSANGPTWIKGKTGEAAGWTPERRAIQSARMTKRMSIQ